MTGINNRTTMGGSDGRFLTTCWIIIADAQISDETRTRLIVNDLLSRYWKPVYCCLRRKGHENESAKDLTQDFFHEIVIGRELIKHADKSKGKFRTFLLTALDRYLIDFHRKQSSSKRKPKGDILQLNEFDIPNPSYLNESLTPEREFNRAWIADLLDKVLSEVKQECKQTQKEVHWAVFTDKVLTPILDAANPSSLADICKKHCVESEAKASNMINTVKRRLRKHLERHLKQIVKSDSEVELEILELLKTLT